MIDGVRTVWRLDHGGDWRRISDDAHHTGSSLEQIAELSAALVSEDDAGAEYYLELGDVALFARRDERGVLVGHCDPGANLMLVRASLARLESVRGDVAGRTERASAGTQSSIFRAEPQPPPTSERAPADAGSADVPIVVSGFEGADSPEGQTPGFDSSSLEDESAALRASRSDDVPFELVIEEASPAASASTERPARRTCEWGDVARWIQSTIAGSNDYIGKMVAANYWRAAIEASELAGTLTVTATGDIRAEAPGAPVRREELARLDDALAAWTRRCSRIIPDVDLVAELDPKPWHDIPHAEIAR